MENYTNSQFKMNQRSLEFMPDNNLLIEQAHRRTEVHRAFANEEGLLGWHKGKSAFGHFKMRIGINSLANIFLFPIILIFCFLQTPLEAHKLIQLKDSIPAFTLYRENGEEISDKDLFGKVVVMNFIFTRCGMPTLCPAATQKMAQLQKLVFTQDLSKEVYFITISFDPDFDKPAVLKQYAQAFGIDLSNYSFLTGDAQVIRDLMQSFGVYIKSEDGTINHTMRTLIFSKQGKMIYENSKKDWQVECLFQVIKNHIKK